MSKFYPDVMVDIETTGVQPDRTAIIQISAVRFNLRQREIDTSPPFDQCLFPMPHRFWDEGTRNWWMSDDNFPVLREKIMPRMREPVSVLEEFGEWLGPPNSGLTMWCQGKFDDQFLSSHFKDARIAFPVHYRNVRDLRSFTDGLFFPSPVPSDEELGITFDGAKHNGIDDCFHQLKRLYKLVDRAAQGVVV